MLALLKPWRSILDLKKEDETFPNVYELFLESASEDVLRIISNIQYFHECSDKAKSEREKSSILNSSTFAYLETGEKVDEDVEETESSHGEDERRSKEECISDDDILEAMEEASNTREMVYADVAMNIAEEFNFFCEESCSTAVNKPAQIASEKNLEDSITWEHCIATSDEPCQTSPSPFPTEESCSSSVTIGEPSINQIESSVSRLTTKQSCLLPAVIEPPTYLNKEQAMAFSIISHHLFQQLHGQNPPQLLMAIHGQGGTGKTRLLKAITSLFDEMGCKDRFAKTALSGVAASQIGGQTLHSWATIPAGKGLPHMDKWIFRPGTETAKRRNGNMQGKLLVAADEISLMTTEVLWLLSQVVTAFRANEGKSMEVYKIFDSVVESLLKGIPPILLNSPFAGLSFILIGDFHQFPPVAGRNRALYSQHPQTSKCQLGRNIYLQFDTVIELRQQIRITDSVWHDILQRARTGDCTTYDLAEMRRLVLTNNECIVPDFESSPWNDAVLITPRNSVQTRWNARATEKHSLQSGQMMYICPSEDSIHGSPLSPSQRLALAQLPLKQTEQLPTMIRIVKGMRVMVTRNVSTSANLSNGSRGRVAEIVLDPREPAIGVQAVEEKRAYLRYPPAIVILQLDFCELAPLPGLARNHVPLFPIQCKFTNDSTRISRRQLPLAPAYAFTDFKAQGQTLDHVLVDIGRTTCFALSPFNAYVALSRSHGRDSIRLLRDFDDALFIRHPSEDLRVEDERIKTLVEDTERRFSEGQFGLG